jgi:peptidoglycan-N-acetylglucosamine deacetylase
VKILVPQRHRGISDDSPDPDSAKAKVSTIISRRGFLRRSAALLAALPILPVPIGDTSGLPASEENLPDNMQDRSIGDIIDPISEPEDLISGPRETGRLFLTFDDGPVPCTMSILDQLAERKQKATFFVIGRNLMQPALRKLAIRAIEEGHEIGNHSFTHPAFSEQTSQRVEQEIGETHKQITALFKEAGLEETSRRLFFRFPYGDEGSSHNYYASMNLLARLGYSIAWWDVDTHDWRLTSSRATKARTRVMASFERAKPHDVVLLHDRKGTADILPSLLEVMKSKSLVSMSLSEYDGPASEVGSPGESYAEPTTASPVPSVELDASEPWPMEEPVWEDAETAQ